ncbi:UDP-N-acetylmuramoyl-tripeptide--D-alanyl-D-alanine ligase [Microlunatus sagamiharensis]|uniref:UDP-N-acetylmuramoyl-tripeptide--D-alanyl-D-alanine ligase n=1 Tax=Microlunatus sagamiharensis TaxID=546874 RepID=A0A1H2MP19_9ACTN|nr:UDP-N-acetylmuramoyl-tripeptide--D-alanyl-D-alanine ligase [Microlunatus sagamiharensis]SDU94987.1 UDP-N-acetylmuramoyl-tripeptide--D-alanyl-D-alanine ligase [Microlunatus sagamiharensis]
MIPLRVGEVASVTGAEVRPGTTVPVDLDRWVTHVTADSRDVEVGSLFVALVGERVDGHAYVAGALAQGAAAVLVAHVVPDAPGPQLVVDDPLVALGQVARRVVDRRRPHGLRVVGLTGSQGKTSTKDLLGAVLATAGPTVAPAGNLNNELGVPLTVGRVGSETSFLVAEMGARGIGHIAYLCRIAPPDVAVVLNVGHAHVGEFGGQEAIARAKGELVEALDDSGTAVLNRDDLRVWAMRSRTRGRVLPFAVVEDGATAPAEPDLVWADALAADDRGRYRFTLHARLAGSEGEAAVALRGTGRHHVANATAAAAAALALGLDLTAVAEALSAAEPASRWRMEVHERADGVTVVNDSYNANPASMAAAVETLAELGRGRGRTWAVLGDMLELGSEAPALHAALSAQVAAAGVDEVIALGEFAPVLVEGQPGRARVAADGAEAARWVRAEVAGGDVVLVKASRGLALNLVADEILSPPGDLPEPDQQPGSGS